MNIANIERKKPAMIHKNSSGGTAAAYTIYFFRGLALASPEESALASFHSSFRLLVCTDAQA